MICDDYGQPPTVSVQGITVLKCASGQSRIPVLKFFYPRFTNVWRALTLTDADVFYKRAAGATNGVIALFAKCRRRPFIYSVACDLDLAPVQLFNKLFERRGRWRNRQLFSLGIRLADAIVCQHDRQVAACLESFGRDAVVIPSCYDSTDRDEPTLQDEVLWVGTLNPGKRPELFLEMARQMPEFRFRMVGGPSSENGGKALFERIRETARAISNLDFTGFVPYHQIQGYFDRARVFVNTSDFEGFPNTFLQAWSRAIPTVSFCDLGSASNGHPVLKVVPDLNAMTAAVRELMTNDGLWRSEGARSRRYVQEVHSQDAAVSAYEALFETLTQSPLAASRSSIPEATLSNEQFHA